MQGFPNSQLIKKQLAGSVLSGQQCSLLGGSLIVLSKIFGIATLAKKENLLPVYWHETNDSDFQEVNHIAFFNKSNSYKVLRWMPKSIQNKNVCIGSIEIDASLISLLKYFFKNVVQTKHTKGLKEIVFKCYKPGTLFGPATMQLLAALCKPYLPENFVFFNPQNQHFINFCKPYLLAQAKQTLPQQQCNLFIKINEQRHSVFKNKSDSGFSLRRGGPVKLQQHTLLPHLQTRSILQDAYFLAKYYVAGPSEQQYLKQLLPNYKKHNVAPAQVIKRMHIYAVSKKNLELWKKLCLPSNLGSLGSQSKKKLLVKNIISLTHSQGETETAKVVLEKFSNFNAATLRKKLQAEKKLYLQKVSSIAINQNLKLLEKKLYKHNKALIGSARKHAKQQMQSKLKNLHNLSQLIHPPKLNGLKSTSQERSINILYLLNLHGGALLKEISKSYAAKPNFAKEKMLALE